MVVSNERYRQSFIEVVYLDFLLGKSDSIILYHMVGVVLDDDNPGWFARVRGDFAVVLLDWNLVEMVLFLRFSTKTCCPFPMETITTVRGCLSGRLFGWSHRASELLRLQITIRIYHLDDV